MIKSPVTGKPATRLVKDIKCDDIVALYRSELGVDVSRFFQGFPAVQIYECLETGYRFYYPFMVAGDAELYEVLQRAPWYYSAGKEEHLIAAERISRNHFVLEVGCGSGIFLDLLREKGARSVGLEFNAEAVSKSLAKGLQVFREPIEEHAKRNTETYDVVASFQVLEHVVDVASFLNSSLQSLKPGGTLIVSVPNNDGPYHKHHNDPLNMPPHHMGLWGINSLIALQTHYPVLLEKLETDTSTPAVWVHQHAVEYVEESLRPKYGMFSPMLCNLAKKFIRRGAESLIPFMPGQTVTAFFRKL